MPKISSAGNAKLRALPARTIVTAVADAAERWRDADFPPRVRATAAIESRLTYTTPVVDYALDRIFLELRRDRLEETIAGELGSLAALDGFAVGGTAGDRWARGVDRVVVVSSDTTIGVGLIPAVFALCAKANVVVKDRSDDFIAAFFETLAHERPEFANAALARTWAGGNDPAERALLAGADVVVAFGAEPALRAIRDACATEARFVPFGHRASIGVIDLQHGRYDAETCERIALDALLYDGAGCLSLHALFAVGADAQSADTLARRMERACEKVEIDFPSVEQSAARGAAVASYRNLAAFRAAAGRGAVFRSAGGATIVLDPPHDEPPPFLPRVLPIYTMANVDDVTDYLASQRIPVQAIGCSDPSAPVIAHLVERTGAVRVARFGEMQSPPLAGRHGGRPRIADFIRWVERA